MTDSPESGTKTYSIFQASRRSGLPEFSTDTSFAALLQKGLERMADFQKIALDLYAHQAAYLIDYWRRMTLPGAPAAYMMDAAEKGIDRCVELQKNLLDLAVRQSMEGIDALRPALPFAAVEPEDMDSMDVFLSDQEKAAAHAAMQQNNW